VLLSFLATVPAAAAGTTVAQVLRATRAAIGHESSVQVSFRAHAPSTKKSEVIRADIGAAEGSETVTVGTATLTVRVTTSAVYVHGNASGLTTVLGLTSAEAKKAGSHWVMWAHGTSQYTTLKPDVTLPSVVELLPKAKGTALSTVTSGGVATYRLKWTTAGSSSEPRLTNMLELTTGAAPLPVEVRSSGSDGSTISTRLSDWGQPIAVTAPPPSDTIAAAKITG